MFLYLHDLRRSVWSIEYDFKNNLANVLLQDKTIEENYNSIYLVQVNVSTIAKTLLPVHKKWSFPLRISSVNVTKFAENFEFGHIWLKKSLMENFIFCTLYIRSSECPVLIPVSIFFKNASQKLVILFPWIVKAFLVLKDVLCFPQML